MPGPVLYRRYARVTLGAADDGTASSALKAIVAASAVQADAFDIEFRIKKNLKPEPNTCELRIFNFAETTRRFLEMPAKLALRLEAGYVNQFSTLFLGEVRKATSYKDGQDIVTEVTTGDAEKDMAKARLVYSLGPKVPLDVALTAIAKTLNVGLGNLEDTAKKLRQSGLTFGMGTTFSGRSTQLLDDFCRSADLEWSIQDGVLQILERKKTLNSQVALLSESTGLIGTPKVDATGLVSATALIQPNIAPGYKVAFDTDTIKGGYRVEQCEYVGQTMGENWYINFQAKKY